MQSVMMRLMLTAKSWQSIDRDYVRGWIEEASQEVLHYNDTLPDTLIANTQPLSRHDHVGPH